MGTSTDGQICFGIIFEEDFEFPWDDEKYGGDVDEWWLYEVLKYTPSFEIYNEEGEYINGIVPDKEIINKYHNEKYKFEEEHEKLPVKLVNYCSCDYPIYILAIPNSCLNANRGYPIEFDLKKLLVTDKDKKSLTDFCKEHNIKYEKEPCWILSSYWG